MSHHQLQGILRVCHSVSRLAICGHLQRGDAVEVGCVVVEMCSGQPPVQLENTVDQVASAGSSPPWRGYFGPDKLQTENTGRFSKFRIAFYPYHLAIGQMGSIGILSQSNLLSF